MTKLISNICIKLAKACGVEPHLRILYGRESALRSQGWLRSARENRSIDADGVPQPWLSYAVIYFISERLKPTQTVFEYGSGGSTFWFSLRCKNIHSVEHDQLWFSKIDRPLPANMTIDYIPLEHGARYPHVAFGRIIDRNAYTDSILVVPKPNVVVVDGAYRNGCVVAAAEAISLDGVIIFDNTCSLEAQAGIEFLRGSGWRQLRFISMGPIVDRICETSVFYRAGNCWDI